MTYLYLHGGVTILEFWQVMVIECNARKVKVKILKSIIST